MRHDDGKIPKHIATGILALIDRLPPGDGLCHCDLSPGNVIMTAEGPKLVDWTRAMRAPAALDLGFLHVILSELAPEIADNPERPRATNAAAQSEYARLAGMSLAALTAAMEPYLPIVRAFVVLGNVVPVLAGAADPAHRSGVARRSLSGRLDPLSLPVFMPPVATAAAAPLPHPMGRASFGAGKGCRLLTFGVGYSWTREARRCLTRITLPSSNGSASA